MRINQIKNTQKFNGLYNNKLLLSGLETISDHSASFVAGVSFLSAVGLRPLAISLTPNVKKENKKILSADSIASGVVKLLVSLGVSLPIEKAVKKINEKPDKFLKKESIEKLSKKDLDFINQMTKMGSGLLSAIPKSLLGIALIPFIFDLFPKDKKEENLLKKHTFDNFRGQVQFKGNKTAAMVSDIINSTKIQEFAIKNSKNDKNIARNMSVATDILLTITGALGTKFSKKIEDKNKKSLIINKILSTAISIFAGCSIDKLVQKAGEGFVENFKKVNFDNPKLNKYLQGLNVARPTIIFALLYYGIIPVLTTFITDKANKNE